MNDINDPTTPLADPQPAATGFCQNCGKSLTQETMRKVGPAVYCEPCLADRIHSAPGQNPPPPGYGPVNVGAGPGAGPGAPFSAFNSSVPNPGLAALLGLIPGVGAMYNEQYAKGVVHLIVFAVLVSLSDNVNGIFGLFVAGWIFYMAIEAHHTARARRDGTPLPNPFGLNDIGERLGFGRSWPAGPAVVDVAADAAAAASQGFHSARSNPVPPYVPPYQAPPAAEPWGAPTDAYAQEQFKQSVTQAAYAKAYQDMGFHPGATAGVPPYAQQPYSPVSPYPPVPPYNPAMDFTAAPSRFPAGAVWLIGLGTVFLLTTTGIFNGFPAEALVGCIMLGLCVWVFLRRMMETGASLASDGTPAYTFRVLRALRVSIWLGALGLLFLLDAFHILTWHHSWPLFIILAGVMALLQRAVYQTASVPYAPPVSAPVHPTTEPIDATQEGK